MKLIEKRANVFQYAKTHHLAHCIASDLRMGAGIAVDFQKKFHLRGILKLMNTKHPTCLRVNRVLNLITKRRSSGKPSYVSMGIALDRMREIVQAEEIKTIAMPRIGCGLDRLRWAAVREMIVQRFADVDVEIVVCRL